MIVDFLLDLIQGAVEFLIGLIPSFSVPGWLDPSGVGGPIGALVGYTSSLSIWIPWGTIMAMLGTVWLVRAGMATVEIAKTVWQLLRG